MESIFACRGYFSLRGYPCVRNPKKSRTPYVGGRRVKEEGGSRWKVASERVDGDVPKEGYGISPEFNPYPRAVASERSCRTFNIVLADLKYEIAPQLGSLCRFRASFVLRTNSPYKRVNEKRRERDRKIDR